MDQEEQSNIDSSETQRDQRHAETMRRHKAVFDAQQAKATREKGQKFVEAVVERMAALLKEFRAREIRPRVDHH